MFSKRHKFAPALPGVFHMYQRKHHDQLSFKDFFLPFPRFHEICHPSHPYIRGLKDMSNVSLQRGRLGSYESRMLRIYVYI
jgi:hypothetical protein